MKIKTFSCTYSIQYPVSAFFNYNKKIIPFMVKTIEEVYPDATDFTFIVRGSSGLIIASAIGMFISKPCTIYYVRKEGERSHSSYNNSLINNEGKHINIIVDDFICTGNTIKEILNNINNYYNNETIIINGLAITGRLNKNTKEIVQTLFKNKRNFTFIFNR